MKFNKDASRITRYIAFDIHKEYALVGGQNARQEWMLQPRRVGMEKFREWAAANLRAGDAAVIETTTNVWDVYDIVAPLVSYAVVAHAGAVRQIAEARVKTDKEDGYRPNQWWTIRSHLLKPRYVKNEYFLAPPINSPGWAFTFPVFLIL